MKKITQLLFLFVFLLEISVVLPQTVDSRVQKIDSLMRIAADQYDFNGTLLIAEKGNIIYQKTVGYANFATKEKLTSNSMFALASISKAFTAMGIMILQEQGRLTYEDDLQKYLPELPYPGITIRQLLNHTSGLPDYERLLRRKWDRDKIATNDDVRRMLQKHRPDALFAPGEKYEYSNTGYVILASIIEKVAHMPFHVFLQQNIFDKLHMERTRVVNRRYRPEIIPDYAFNHVFSIAQGGYTITDNVERFGYVYFLDGIVGDGCVNSTAADMLKWDQALYTETLVSRQTLKEAFNPPELTGKSETDYGFGWHITHTPHGRRIEHGGGYAGYINKFIRLTDKKQTVIMLSNNSFRYSKMVNCFVDILNEQPFSLPPVNVDAVLSHSLINTNMLALAEKVQTMVADTVTYQINENAINNLGYELLTSDRLADAIAVFHLNILVFPASANAYDSLGEAYMTAKKYPAAITNYEKSLKLNPGNNNAKEMLAGLREIVKK